MVSGAVKFASKRNSAPGITKAQNGLNLFDAITVELGGDLLKSTTINQNGFDLLFTQDLGKSIFGIGKLSGNISDSDSFANLLIGENRNTDFQNSFANLFLHGEFWNSPRTIINSSSNIFHDIDRATITGCQYNYFAGIISQSTVITNSSRNVFPNSINGTFTNVISNIWNGGVQSGDYLDVRANIINNLNTGSHNNLQDSIISNLNCDSEIILNSLIIECSSIGAAKISKVDKSFLLNVKTDGIDTISNCYLQLFDDSFTKALSFNNITDIVYKGFGNCERSVTEFEKTMFLGDVNFLSGVGFTQKSFNSLFFGNVDIGNDIIADNNFYIGAEVLSTGENLGSGNLFLNVGDISSYSLTGNNKNYIKNFTFLDNGFVSNFETETLTDDRNVIFQDKDGTVALLSDISGGGGTLEDIVTALHLQICNQSIFVNNNTAFLTSVGLGAGQYSGMVIHLFQNTLSGAANIPIQLAVYNQNTGLRVALATSTITESDGDDNKVGIFPVPVVLTAGTYFLSFWKGTPSDAGQDVQLAGRNDAFSTTNVNAVYSNAAGLVPDLATEGLGTRNTAFYIALF